VGFGEGSSRATLRARPTGLTVLSEEALARIFGLTGSHAILLTAPVCFVSSFDEEKARVVEFEIWYTSQILSV